MRGVDRGTAVGAVPPRQGRRRSDASGQQRLSSSLGDFVAGTARCHRDDVGPILDELFDLIREHIVRRVDEAGLATPRPPAAPNANGPNVVDDNSIVREGVSGWNR
jgi:hypothetical protein